MEREALAVAIGEVIRPQREALGLSRGALVKRADPNGPLDQSTIKNIENGKTLASWDTLEKIAPVIGATPLDILDAAVALAQEKMPKRKRATVDLRVLPGQLDQQTGASKKKQRASKSAGKSSSAHSIPNLHKRPPNPQPLRSKFPIPPVTEVALAGSNA